MDNIYVVTDGQNIWLDVYGDQIQKDEHGSTLVFQNGVLIASYPKNCLVSIKRNYPEAGTTTVTPSSIH